MKRTASAGKPIAGAQALLAVVRWNEQGLIPAVIQDARSKQVLTLCYLNRAALLRSLQTGTVHVFRRSQNRLMQKGETSGHIQTIRRVMVDCEGKSLVFIVRQRIAACHTGYVTCYFRRLADGALRVMGRTAFDPAAVYQRT